MPVIQVRDAEMTDFLVWLDLYKTMREERAGGTEQLRVLNQPKGKLNGNIKHSPYGIERKQTEILCALSH